MSAGKLYRARAGWYETTKGEPVDGTLAVIAYDHEGDAGSSWYVARYERNATDGGLDLVSTGDYFATLRDARQFLAEESEG